jgi:beta-barrel assembly-enhancing protease
MKPIVLAIALLSISVPAFAQFGGLGGALKKAQESKQKLDDMTISDAEERQIGEEVSQKIRARFGVVQDPAIHKYVTLLGNTLAQLSERPDLDWTFIVLDTDGVNAFASPGGLVHVTRGALAFAKNEAELAGVMGHEIGHVARRHTINAIKKGKAVQMGTQAASRSSFLSNYANRAYEMVLENSFDRGDELDADKVGVQLAQKAGYAASALGNFLARLDDRNKEQEERNGLFASHPETKERIDKITQMAGGAHALVLVETRYKANVKYPPTAITSIAVVTEGSAGLAGSTKEEPKQDAKKEEPKKKGGLLGGLKQTVAPEKQSTQVSASGGARGLGADRAAKGGSNPNLVKATVSETEVGTFKKGIA